jgi:hypothetical protein
MSVELQFELLVVLLVAIVADDRGSGGRVSADYRQAFCLRSPRHYSTIGKPNPIFSP